MEPFIHKTYIGDFFDVLYMKSPLPGHITGVCVSLFGATGKQEAVLTRFFGDLQLSHAQEFGLTLESLLSGPVQLVVLDLAALTTFCSNAAAHLLNFAASVQGRNKKLIIFQPSSAVYSMLEHLGLLYIFTIATRENELLSALPE